MEEVKVAKITLAENENKDKCSSCTLYIVLMIVAFTICAGISTYFVYYNWSLLKMFRALSLLPVLKQRFCKLINRKVKQITIKTRTYYFYNDQINLKDFDASLLKVDKKDYNEIDIYYVGYVTVEAIANCNNINNVND